MKIMILVMLTCVLAGCSSNGSDDQKVAKKDTGYECEKVRVTGKLIPKTICTTTAQRKKMKENGQEGLRNRRIAVTDVIQDGY